MSYLPKKQTELVAWLNNFSTKMRTTYGATLGFTSAELTTIGNEATVWQNTVQYRDALRQGASTMSDIVQALQTSADQISLPPMPAAPVLAPLPAGVLSGMFKRIIGYVNRIKRHPSYTDAIGNDLGIIAPVVVFNPATMQPVLKGRVDSGFPRLSWSKGDAHAVQLYVDRRDGSGFVPLAMRISTSYIDTTAFPENTFSATWEYKAKYIINDDEVGLFSEVVSLNIVRI